MILASAVLSQYTRVTDRQTTDRQHLIGTAELAMQLERSAKNHLQADCLYTGISSRFNTW